LLLTGQLHSQLHAVAEQIVAVLNKSEAAEHVTINNEGDEQVVAVLNKSEAAEHVVVV
jgi:hypothetical protein